MLRKKHLLVAAVMIGAMSSVGAAYAFGFGYGPDGYGPGNAWQQGGPGVGQGMRAGVGPGMHRGNRGPQARGIAPWAADGDVTVDEVKQVMSWRMQQRNNPNVKLGNVEVKDGAIIAEVVTKEGSLVNRIEFDRTTGWMHPAP